jgi:hypothetical protein
MWSDGARGPRNGACCASGDEIRVARNSDASSSMNASGLPVAIRVLVMCCSTVTRARAASYGARTACSIASTTTSGKVMGMAREEFSSMTVVVYLSKRGRWRCRQTGDLQRRRLHKEKHVADSGARQIKYSAQIRSNERVHRIGTGGPQRRATWRPPGRNRCRAAIRSVVRRGPPLTARRPPRKWLANHNDHQ